ncbi:MAG TPA: hypothetical protein PK735_12515 [Flavobacteriales bacterium]|nr:hypothetical protein [Flavobacteriales bacterium]
MNHIIDPIRITPTAPTSVLKRTFHGSFIGPQMLPNVNPDITMIPTTAIPFLIFLFMC